MSIHRTTTVPSLFVTGEDRDLRFSKGTVAQFAALIGYHNRRHEVRDVVNYPHYHFDPLVDWGIADMAPQLWLGILSGRRNQPGPVRFVHRIFYRQVGE